MNAYVLIAWIVIPILLSFFLAIVLFSGQLQGIDKKLEATGQRPAGKDRRRKIVIGMNQDALKALLRGTALKYEHVEIQLAMVEMRDVRKIMRELYG